MPPEPDRSSETRPEEPGRGEHPREHVRPADRSSETRPEGYDPSAFAPFAVTVDIVLMTILDRELRVLLIRRGKEPYKDTWALPGGFVHPDEDLATAAARELMEETGIGHSQGRLEQLGTYGNPARDPRMRVVTVAHRAIVPRLDQVPRGGSDASHAELKPVAEVQNGRVPLAFDHGRIVDDAVEGLRAGLETTTIAHSFCPPEFTIRELQGVYEAVWQTELDAGNFQRKVRQRSGFITPTGRQILPGDKGGRPAELWRGGDSDELSTFLTRNTRRRRSRPSG